MIKLLGLGLVKRCFQLKAGALCLGKLSLGL